MFSERVEDAICAGLSTPPPSRSDTRAEAHQAVARPSHLLDRNEQVVLAIEPSNGERYRIIRLAVHENASSSKITRGTRTTARVISKQVSCLIPYFVVGDLRIC